VNNLSGRYVGVSAYSDEHGERDHCTAGSCCVGVMIGNLIFKNV
jgi:hypothetical protein